MMDPMAEEARDRSFDEPARMPNNKMPKFILATAAFTAAVLLRREGSPAALQEALRARTRTRDATRRLRESRIHELYVDLSPLKLTKRH